MTILILTEFRLYVNKNQCDLGSVRTSCVTSCSIAMIRNERNLNFNSILIFWDASIAGDIIQWSNLSKTCARDSRWVSWHSFLKTKMQSMKSKRRSYRRLSRDWLTFTQETLDGILTQKGNLNSCIIALDFKEAKNGCTEGRFRSSYNLSHCAHVKMIWLGWDFLPVLWCKIGDSHDS